MEIKIFIMFAAVGAINGEAIQDLGNKFIDDESMTKMEQILRNINKNLVKLVTVFEGVAYERIQFQNKDIEKEIKILVERMSAAEDDIRSVKSFAEETRQVMMKQENETTEKMTNSDGPVTEIRFCPAHFTLLHCQCYFFSENVTNKWDDARMHCKSLDPNADLVNIETDHEWQNIKTNMVAKNLTSGSWWVGASDREEGNWVWTKTNQSLVFSEWCPKYGNDNYGGKENCATLQSYASCWNDLPCKYFPLHYICEGDT